MGDEKIDIQKARGLLENLGIQPYLCGYKMTLLALERIAENQECIYAVIKEIYLPIAEKLNCNSRSGNPSYFGKSVESKPGINERTFYRNTARQASDAIISFDAIQCMLHKEIVSILCPISSFCFTEQFQHL